MKRLRKPKADDPLRVNFSGYPIPPDSTRTVAELEAFYLAPGYKGEDGEPISGDETARFAYWRRTGHYPRFKDLPPIKPANALF